MEKNKRLQNLINNSIGTSQRSNTYKQGAENWKNIKWTAYINNLRTLQQELVKFYSIDDFQEVARIQHKILTSRATHCLAIRKVLSNKGGNTSGVDKMLLDTAKKRWDGVILCWHIMQNPRMYEPQPLKRVYIEKANGKKKRPLSIPTIIDRCIQAIYLSAMDPIVECISDTESFGFRKNRSTHDAILCLRGKLVHPSAAEHFLSCGIKGCFDNIAHDHLLKVIWKQRIVNRKSDLEVIDKWLKSKVLTETGMQETVSGTPQGGVISPLLSNIALNGLQDAVKNSVGRKGWRLKDESGKVKELNLKVHTVRYADDIIIIAPAYNLIKEIILPAIERFLSIRGLSLNMHKTYTASIYEGFEFLGFRFFKRKFDHRKVWVKKKHVGTHSIIVLPTKANVKDFNLKLKNIMKSIRKATQLILKLNPILRGWANYYRITHTSANFVRKFEHVVWKKLMRWLKRTYPKINVTRRVRKHFKEKEFIVGHKVVKRKWIFVSSPLIKTENATEIILYSLGVTKAPGMARLTVTKNPYREEDTEYFNKRTSRYVPIYLTNKEQKLYKKQKGKCKICKEELITTESLYPTKMEFTELDIHHQPPIYTFDRAEDWIGELWLVHRQCHHTQHSETKPSSV